jgi:hypothetical protein
MDSWSGTLSPGDVLGSEIGSRARRTGLGYDSCIVIAAGVEAWSSQRREHKLDEPSEGVVWEASLAETHPGTVVGVGEIENRGGQCC